MTTVLPTPKARFFDANGDPLSGGKVYFYEAGTSTPKNTYTDFSGNTANTNPVILDSQGYANIWLGDNLYKVSLFDANNNLIYTVDNIGQQSMAGQQSGFGQSTDIASAGLVDLGSITSHFANITGTTTITSFGSSAVVTNPIYLVKFDNSLTLTQSSNLLLPGGANIITNTSDYAFAEYLGSGTWRLLSYFRANGTPVNLLNTIVNGTLQVNQKIDVKGTTAGPGFITLAEDLDNGTDTVTLSAPFSMSGSKSQSFQDVDGVVAVVNDLYARPLQVQIASNISSITFNSSLITDTYRNYVLLVTDAVPSIDAVGAQLLVSSDNGSTYQSSYRNFGIVASSNATAQSNVANATGTVILASSGSAGALVGNAAGESYSARITFNNLRGSMFKSVRVSADYTSEPGYANIYEGTSQTNSTNVINSIQFKFTTGNILSGTFALYGIK